jgi:hypothetical protein
MRHLPALVAVLACLTAAAQPPQGPSPQAVQQVEARRKHLEAMGVWFMRPVAPLKEADVQKALAQLQEALASPDGYVYEQAVGDLTNQHYVTFPAEPLLELLLPRLKAPETEQRRVLAQSFVMEYLGRHYGPKAKKALPDLLRIVTDVKASPYLRGQAVEAAARIGPGDPAVVAAFIEATTNPEPKTSSGVHDRIAEKLGDMGKAAWPAKKALIKIFERDPWYEDVAFVALGKLAMDDPPRPLGDYLDRLAKIDEVPMEQAAAAFLHVAKHCHPDVAARPPQRGALPASVVDVARELKKVDRKQAEQTRPVLLKVVESRPGSDVFIRAALRVLATIGPGSDAHAARVVVGVLTRQPVGKTHDAREDASAALALLEPADKAAVPVLAEGLDRLLKEESHDWVRCRNLAEVIARYGKDARPAVPVLIRALERFRTPPAFPAYEELTACADALAAAGGDVPGARIVLLHLLDADAPLLKKAGPEAVPVQARLLLALGRMGLPPAGEERDAVLDRIRGGLGSDRVVPFSAACKVVAGSGPDFTVKEARSLVPLLVRVLADDFHFKDEKEPSAVLPAGFAGDENPLRGPGLAVRALAALGPRAQDALPQLEALANRPLENVKGTFLPDPPLNHVIREARKAVKAIQ